MKKLTLLIPALLFSCTKKESSSEVTASQDSAVTVLPTQPQPDSAAAGEVRLPETTVAPVSKAFRTVEGNKIIKTINGDMFPVHVTDEFNQDQQEYVLKIKNVPAGKITGKIVPAHSEMNIRFNQIKLADGTLDGPFGRELTYDVPKAGEIWLIVGKSNMASGDATGRFTIDLK